MTADRDHEISTITKHTGMRASASLDVVLGTLRLELDGIVLDAYTEQARRRQNGQRVARVAFFDPATDVEVGSLYSSKNGDETRGRIHFINGRGLANPVGEYVARGGTYQIVPVIGGQKLFDNMLSGHPIDYFFQRYDEALAAGMSIVNANHLRKYGTPLDRQLSR